MKNEQAIQQIDTITFEEVEKKFQALKRQNVEPDQEIGLDLILASLFPQSLDNLRLIVRDAWEQGYKAGIQITKESNK